MIRILRKLGWTSRRDRRERSCATRSSFICKRKRARRKPPG